MGSDVVCEVCTNAKPLEAKYCLFCDGVFALRRAEKCGRVEFLRAHHVVWPEPRVLMVRNVFVIPTRYNGDPSDPALSDHRVVAQDFTTGEFMWLYQSTPLEEVSPLEVLALAAL